MAGLFAAAGSVITGPFVAAGALRHVRRVQFAPAQAPDRFRFVRAGHPGPRLPIADLARIHLYESVIETIQGAFAAGRQNAVRRDGDRRGPHRVGLRRPGAPGRSATEAGSGCPAVGRRCPRRVGDVAPPVARASVGTFALRIGSRGRDPHQHELGRFRLRQHGRVRRRHVIPAGVRVDLAGPDVWRRSAVGRQTP